MQQLTQPPGSVPTIGPCRRFRVAVPFAVVGGATILGAAAGAGIGLSAGWGHGAADPVVRAAVWAAAAWLIAGGIGLIALFGVARGHDDRFGVAVLGCSMARMLIALTIAVGVLVVGGQEGRSFLTAFLCAGLMALAAETVWAMVKAASTPSGPAVSPLRPASSHSTAKIQPSAPAGAR